MKILQQKRMVRVCSFAVFPQVQHFDRSAHIGQAFELELRREYTEHYLCQQVIPLNFWLSYYTVALSPVTMLCCTDERYARN